MNWIPLKRRAMAPKHTNGLPPTSTGSYPPVQPECNAPGVTVFSFTFRLRGCPRPAAARKWRFARSLQRGGVRVGGRPGCSAKFFGIGVKSAVQARTGSSCKWVGGLGVPWSGGHAASWRTCQGPKSLKRVLEPTEQATKQPKPPRRRFETFALR